MKNIYFNSIFIQKFVVYYNLISEFTYFTFSLILRINCRRHLLSIHQLQHIYVYEFYHQMLTEVDNKYF